MSDRNVFNAMQAELRPHYDSDDEDLSENEYVPPNLLILRKIVLFGRGFERADAEL